MSTIETTPDTWQMSARERRLLVGAIWLVCLMFACGQTIADPDLWGHTLYGMRAHQNHVLAEYADPFSYTVPGAVWINHEWLTEYIFGWLWLHWGSTGLWFWRNAMVAIVFACAALAIHRARASVAAIVALLVLNAECLSEFVVFVRPQLATFALFAVTLLVLRRHWDTPGTRVLWILPPLTGLWANLHGGFLSGLGLQAVFFAAWFIRSLRPSNLSEAAAEICEAQRRSPRREAMRIVFLTGASLAATLINPYGFHLHRMLIEHLVPYQPIREWQPLWAAPQAATFYVPFLLTALALPWSRRRNWLDLLVLTVVGYEAVSHIRHVALLSITTLILLPGPLSDSFRVLFKHLSQQMAGDHRRWHRAIAVSAVLLSLLSLQIIAVDSRRGQGIQPWQIAAEVSRDVAGVPMNAVTFLDRSGVEGNLVTTYGWSQYVLWHLYPRVHIAFDGRYRTVYPMSLERDFLLFEMADGTNAASTAILDKYPTDIALLPRDRRAAEDLRHRPGWVQIYADTQAVVFIRDLPRYQTVINSSGRGATSDRKSTDLKETARYKWQRFPAGPHQTPASVQSPKGQSARKVRQGQASHDQNSATISSITNPRVPEVRN